MNTIQMLGKAFNISDAEFADVLATSGQIILDLYQKYGVRATHISTSEVERDAVGRQLATAFGLELAGNNQPPKQVLIGISHDALKTRGPQVMELDLPQSSRLTAASYDKTSQELLVTFREGRVYRYKGVPLATALALESAKSVGAKFQDLIVNGNYQYEEVAAQKSEAELEEDWGNILTELNGPAKVEEEPPFDVDETEEEEEVEDEIAVSMAVEGGDWNGALAAAFGQLGRNPKAVYLGQDCPAEFGQFLKDKAAVTGYIVATHPQADYLGLS